MKRGINFYHRRSGRTTIVDKRPVPQLSFPVDAVFRAEEKERKRQARLRKLQEIEDGSWS